MDDWLHLKYAKFIAEKYAGINLYLYGPNVHKVKDYYFLTPYHYNKNLKMRDLINHLKIDVIIINTKSRMFEYYNPFTKEARNCFLPDDFNKIKIPKIVIEEDFHYEENDDWYYDVGIDLILQRHYSQAQRQGKVKTLWHPFSVDTKVFKDNKYIKRKNKVCFSGSCTDDAYEDRRNAFNELYNYDLVDIYGQRQKTGLSYINCLQSYVCHLSTKTKYDITAAKNFEIMSSGSVLLTNKFSGIDLLFPENSYVLFENENDIVQKAKKIIDDNSYRKEIVDNAIKCINENHSHEIRTKQLVNIIKKEL